jgi:hypothetical protein
LTKAYGRPVDEPGVFFTFQSPAGNFQPDDAPLSESDQIITSPPPGLVDGGAANVVSSNERVPVMKRSAAKEACTSRLSNQVISNLA